MEKVLLVVHAIIAVLLVFIILLQKSDTDGLKGMGGGDVGGDALFSRGGSATFLTKITVILAILFMVNCLVLSNISSKRSAKNVVAQIDKKISQQKKAVKNLPMAE